MKTLILISSIFYFAFCSCGTAEEKKTIVPEKEINTDMTKKLPADFEYLKDMYQDGYYPDFLVDKVKKVIKSTVSFIEEGTHTKDEIQAAFDKMTISINELSEEFEENGSEIETGARESIAETVDKILKYFSIDIDVEEAIREREW